MSETTNTLREVLSSVRKSLKNARGAIESNQVVDKDVHGTLTRVIAAIDAALASPAPPSLLVGGDTSEFYLNSGEKIVVDRGFMVSVANLLEHGAFEENTTDADTATEYANELYRVLFAQRGGKKNGEMLDLLSAARGLKRIVEEIDGAMRHGTWRDEHGVRLKDTPEWVALYNAFPALSAEVEG